MRLKQTCGLWTMCLTLFLMSCECCPRRPTKRHPDRSKPTLTCPFNKEFRVQAENKKDTARARWTEPVYGYDDRDGQVPATRRGLGPGDVFPAGRTRIAYTAFDRHGNWQRCAFDVVVEVEHCDPVTTPANGWVSCDPSNKMVKGTTCTFGCHKGYLLDDTRKETVTSVCDGTPGWRRSAPLCTVVKCPTLPDPVNTNIDKSNGNNFNSIARYSCTNGFDILPGHNRVRICQADGSWGGHEPVCKDVSPPVFENCPSVLVDYADQSKTSSLVAWTVPRAIDNAGNGTSNIHFAQTRGPATGSILSVGEYAVSYTATDQENNSAMCSFTIILKQIMCHSLYPHPYTSVICPEGRIYGSTCNFVCDNGTALDGPGSVECGEHESSTATVKFGKWSFGSYQPKCELLETCSTPIPPDNGALACDVWFSGRYCQALCRNGYILPNANNLMTFCNDKGIWSKLDDGKTVPNCQETDEFTALFVTLDEKYYFDGDCSSSIDEIKSNFIAAYSETYGKSCGSTGCTVDGVQVICGDDQARRRRELDWTLAIRTILKVEVRKDSEEGVGEVLAVIESLSEKAFNSTFSVNGTKLVSRGVEVLKTPTVQCNDGYYLDETNMRCVKCSPGTFYDITLNSCVKCPRGQFQPSAGQTSCMPCPNKFTTEKVGSRFSSDCTESCPPGLFSAYGIPPCSPCDFGQYSKSHGSISCTDCPGSKTTKKLGSQTDSDCFDFDLDLGQDVTNNHQANISISIPIESTSFIVQGWLLVKSNGLIFTILDNAKNNVLSMDHSDTLSFVYGGCPCRTSVRLIHNSTRWSHFAIIVSDDHVELRIDGENVMSAVCAEETGILSGLYTVTVGGFGGRISQLNMWNIEDNNNTVDTSSNCFIDHTGDILSWKMFEDVEGRLSPVESLCDAIDNCASNPCVNGGICKDEPGSFSCVCQQGFTGHACDINLDDCLHAMCENDAICIDGVASYTCLCKEGFTGSFCEVVMVDGGWSEWGYASTCSVTCGKGTQERKRDCTNPEPANGGMRCEGDSTEMLECSVTATCHNECDADPTELENGSLNCSWIGQNNDTRACFPYCDSGFDFESSEFLQEILCGPDTAYTWNIRNEDNPEAQLPMCTRKVMAIYNRLLYFGQYDNLTTEAVSSAHKDAEETILTTVQEQVNGLECISVSRCTLDKLELTRNVPTIDDNNEYSNHRRTRSTEEESSLAFYIELACIPESGISECYEILEEAYYNLQASVNERQFAVPVNGDMYDIMQNGTTIFGKVKCGPGAVDINEYCVYCGTGSYQRGAYCERCARGTYQDEIGQTECKPCPDGLTTMGLQSRNASKCSVAEVDENSTDNIYVYIIVGALFMLIATIVILLVICRASVGNEKHKHSGVNGSFMKFRRVSVLPWGATTSKSTSQDGIEKMPPQVFDRFVSNKRFQMFSVTNKNQLTTLHT